MNHEQISATIINKLILRDNNYKVVFLIFIGLLLMIK